MVASKSLGVALLLLLSSSVDAFIRRKVKRVQAGKKYEKNEEVHIVVNKVG